MFESKLLNKQKFYICNFFKCGKTLKFAFAFYVLKLFISQFIVIYSWNETKW